MSYNTVRGLQSAARSLMRYTGASVSSIRTENGEHGAATSDAVSTVVENIEKAEPRITSVHIQGSRLHLSTKDPKDSEQCVTGALNNDKGTRVGTIHVHTNSTWKFFPSRAGRQGGYEANIIKANIPGYIPLTEEEKKSETED